ncbi:tetratricopeptide repeat protein [Streptomyces winkii]|uniref:tetratricopeptide repeat protein n=1 Tax=Streptomyces winkii TaxID=3051178 RepID=UPI0028D0109B|nr:tetratricopeptide repeat protein [Streptomyces sp. DSM 40971]
MTGRGRLSRQELIRLQRRDGFVGRRGELATFRENLGRSPEDGAEFLFHVHGPAGVGKSTLLGQMAESARERQIATASVDESAVSVVEAMEAVSGQLAQQGLALKTFDKQLTVYRQRRHEAEAGTGGALAGRPGAPGDPQGTATGAVPALSPSPSPSPSLSPSPPSPSPSSVIASQVGLVGLGMVPGLGAFTGAVDPTQLAVGADRLRAMLSSRFRNQDDVQLVLSPLQVLTPAFLADLHEVAQRCPWVALFFDTYERTGPILDTWLRDILFSERYGSLPANVLVVLAGQTPLEPRCWGDYLEFVTDLPLEVFTEAEARQLLTGKGVTGERVVQIILQLSGRLPVLVSTLAESRPADVDEVGDPSGTAVERFLKWESDPARRAVALSCALPQELDEDVYRAAAGHEAAESFDWLRTLPFVNNRSGHCRYHDVVRAAMLRLQRTRSPRRWQEQHVRLADAFRTWRRQLQDGDPARAEEKWWDDQRWREYLLQETYHRLCADPRPALPAALRELLDAYDHGLTTLRRWVHMLSRAADDTADPALLDWARRLLSSLKEEAGAGVAVLTLLLARGELDVGGRVFAHTLRGRDRRTADAYEQALADYDAALALDPDAARARYGRGETYRLMGRYDDALADLDRAVELGPHEDWIVASRGCTYFLMDRNEEAVADLDRAIELDPDDAWNITLRGLAHRSSNRLAEAMADFERAVELEPELDWAIANRGDTHRLSDRPEQALPDFDRAIRLDPDYSFAIAHRGLTYRSLGRFDEALADFDRAIELDPEYSWAIAHRGLSHRLAGRYEEALADFERAVELEPDLDWAIANRGRTYRSLGRFDEALADFDRAVELDPEYGWAIANRAEVHASLGQLDAAMADFDRAVELDPEYSWAIAHRAEVQRLMGRDEEALADFDRAVELEPELDWAIGSRGQIHQRAGRLPEALADFDRVLGLHPDDAWGLTLRGITYRLMGRDEEASADLDRATELMTQEAAGEGTEADRAKGNRFIVHCARSQWDLAGDSLEVFLGSGPDRELLRDAVMDLDELTHLFPSLREHVLPYRRRLENALGGE